MGQIFRSKSKQRTRAASWQKEDTEPLPGTRSSPSIGNALHSSPPLSQPNADNSKHDQPETTTVSNSNPHKKRGLLQSLKTRITGGAYAPDPRMPKSEIDGALNSPTHRGRERSHSLRDDIFDSGLSRRTEDTVKSVPQETSGRLTTNRYGTEQSSGTTAGLGRRNGEPTLQRTLRRLGNFMEKSGLGNSDVDMETVPRTPKRKGGVKEQRQFGSELEEPLTEDWIRLKAMMAQEARQQNGEDGVPECMVCSETLEEPAMVKLVCRHWICLADLSNGFQLALKSRVIWACCGCRISSDLIKTSGLLPEDVLREYDLMILERDTEHPIYCSNELCASFIPPVETPVKAPFLTCGKCQLKTCKNCRMRGHPSKRCATGVDLEVERLRKMGYKECPWCHNMVMKNGGCEHITCRCGREFCYHCGGKWRCNCRYGSRP